MTLGGGHDEALQLVLLELLGEVELAPAADDRRVLLATESMVVLPWEATGKTSLGQAHHCCCRVGIEAG